MGAGGWVPVRQSGVRGGLQPCGSQACFHFPARDLLTTAARQFTCSLPGTQIYQENRGTGLIVAGLPGHLGHGQNDEPWRGCSAHPLVLLGRSVGSF